MAEDKKEKLPLFVSAPGKAKKYATLQYPDEKYGHFGVKLTFEPEDDGYEWAQGLTAQMDELQEEALQKAKAAFKPTKDKKKFVVKYADKSYSVDEDTGTITINFKKPGSFKKKVDGVDQIVKTVLPLFDAKGNRIPSTPDIKIGEGSVLKVSYTIQGFYTPIGAGTQLRLVAAKVLELVEWVAGGDASDYGFEVEDGYEAGTPKEADAEDPEAIDTPEPEPEAEPEPEMELPPTPAPKPAAKAAPKPAAKPVPKPVPAEIKGKPVVAPAVKAAAAKAKAAAKPAADEDSGDF